MTEKTAKEKLSQINDIRELWKGDSLELLKVLHIITRDEKLNADSRRKLKQVYHLIQLIEPIIQQLYAKNPNLKIVDMGAGKSYLGFILYDLVLRKLEGTRLVGVETRDELVQKSKELANSGKFERMEFVASTIEAASNAVKGPLDLVCALHACDTATDDAILFGIHTNAKAFALVPCCQAEIAEQLRTKAGAGSLVDLTLQTLFAQPIHRREFGSHITNVIRTLFLQSKGYKTTVTELIGWEHSLKNELILAEKVSTPDHPQSIKSQKMLDELLLKFQLSPRLVNCRS